MEGPGSWAGMTEIFLAVMTVIIGPGDYDIWAGMTSSINLSSPRAFERGSPEKAI